MVGAERQQVQVMRLRDGAQEIVQEEVRSHGWHGPVTTGEPTDLRFRHAGRARLGRVARHALGPTTSTAPPGEQGPMVSCTGGPPSPAHVRTGRRCLSLTSALVRSGSCG